MSGSNVFSGCIPALMTPCDASGTPDFDALAHTGSELIRAGMRAVVYCGSMGDWPLLSNADRQAGVAALVAAGVPVIVGTGAQNTRLAVDLARHAAEAGADGLMVIPRVLSRGSSPAAHDVQAIAALLRDHYGFETRADLFFALRDAHANLVGFKEFGGSDSLTYAAENITSGDEELSLMVGVDTQVVHGLVRCGADGAITGVGNALPREILHLVKLCQRAAAGDHEAFRLARELDDALAVLSRYDEGPDLVLYYKQLMVLEGHAEYGCHINPTDRLSAAQSAQLESQWRQFRAWWASWPGTAA
ncbi:MAG: dihydrodipicolinate synthase family protein [Gammaproteobacteria bacterium]